MFSYDWGLSGSCLSMRPTSSPQRGFSHRRRFRLPLVHPSKKGWWLRPDFAFLQLLSNSWCEVTFTRRGGEFVDCTHPRYLGKVKYLLTWSAFLIEEGGNLGANVGQQHLPQVSTQVPCKESCKKHCSRYSRRATQSEDAPPSSLILTVDQNPSLIKDAENNYGSRVLLFACQSHGYPGSVRTSSKTSTCPPAVNLLMQCDARE